MRYLIIAAIAGVGLAGCNSTASAPPPGAPTMSVAFRWCAGTPETTVGSIPAGTKTLSFRLIDRQVPSFMHGGGTIEHDGKPTAKIACSALTGGYNGPNPPPPQVHDYDWTVTALDASGKALAAGRASRKFPE